jgi:hypothetical protein
MEEEEERRRLGQEGWRLIFFTSYFSNNYLLWTVVGILRSWECAENGGACKLSGVVLDHRTPLVGRPMSSFFFLPYFFYLE